MSDRDPAPHPRAGKAGEAKGSREERRRYDRHEVDGLHGSFQFTTDARIVDISLDGLGVETNSYLQIGRRYALKLQAGSHVLPLQARVVWCTLKRTTKSESGEVLPVYRAGIRFEEILSEAATDLYKLIEKKAVIDLEKRLFGRFKIHPEQAATFDRETDFAVRKISLSGMLIETDAAPEIDSTFEMEILFNSKKLYTIGRIVHVQPIESDDGQPRALIGVEFINLGRSNRQKLEEFIRAQLA